MDAGLKKASMQITFLRAYEAYLEIIMVGAC
jgi:hypothetical protein